ncbi:MAG: type II toxin-antitoxin system RelE/ParE family toxin [Candidatus Eremiobacteraeota bacterium]|nr:type II toxin-antitoxin system RelE/ParE family toxin [Candidatus Eremiobacteraeota bacterium]MCL5055138.1 type II toxin-antitoxin system RelE/ParE family toxin [Bacillota bacterium]
MFRVVYTPAFGRDLRKLHSDIQKRIKLEVDSLPDNPFPANSLKLSGEESTWRLRIGNYRVTYEVNASLKLIYLLHAAHRKDIY